MCVAGFALTNTPCPIGQQSSTEPSQSAAAVRIRDNQRRSRARRKEYVENLEQKIQEYEKQGVDATLKMQHAARTVALENSRLRLMLAHVGASDSDIESFLQSCQDREAAEALSSVSLRPLHHDQQEQGQLQSITKNGGRRDPSLPLTQAGDNEAAVEGSKVRSSVTNISAADVAVKAEHTYFTSSPKYNSSTHVYSHEHQPKQSTAGFDTGGVYGPYSSHSSASSTQDNPFDKLDVLASATLQQGGCCEGKTQCTTTLPTPASEAPSPSTVEPSTGAVTPLSAYAPELSPGASTVVQDFSSPMEMSCNAAAAIIAEMQGHADRDMTKARLGCRGRNECFVRNTVLFQILESENATGQYS
ncbi:hypothetical protein QQS21_007231 [Conoideocrella luteorostrata]|uniref:BZIP domain-containing protein n=1 Tax=Conoideocrella luteorostrata TaxID=1105319 RepID=A0AAJ0CQF5_9HYPO|nr:hypothetical protein QQS21_007231 [Conoideocrella luteorostrata]